MDGVNGWGAGSNTNMGEFGTTDYPVENYDGKTIQSILDEISTAFIGVWYINTNSELILVGFGSDYSNAFIARDHEKTYLNDEITVLGLEMTNSDTGEKWSFGNTDYSNTGKVFRISSRYATEAIANAVWNRINGFQYQAWSCGTVVDTQGGVPFTGAFAAFTDENGNNLIANSVRYEISGQTLYASLSANDVSESEIEYKPKVDRELAKRVEYDKGMNDNSVVINENWGIQYKNKDPDTGTVTVANTNVLQGSDVPRIYDGVPELSKKFVAESDITYDSTTGVYTIVDHYDKIDEKDTFTYDKTTGKMITLTHEQLDKEGNPIGD
jgi:hypothetical protein